MSVNFKLLGKRVREVRKEKGISQADLAVKCKTSAQYLSQIENGKKQASLQILITIAEALEVSLDELLVGNQVKNLAEYSNEVARVFEDCSSYEKRILFEMLVAMKSVIRDNKELLRKELEKI